MTAPLRRLDFGLVSRDWSSFCVHNNVMYAAVFGGYIYRLNPDGSDIAVVSQNRKWYKMVSAFGKLYATTNQDAADGVYEIDPFAGTATRVYALANCYCITQFKKNLYISAITGYVRKLVPGTWTATSHGTSDAYRELSPSVDGQQIAACAARNSGNYGGVLHLYNPETWARVTIGSDARRSAIILDENNYITGLGLVDILHGLDGSYGSGDRPLSTTSNTVPGLFNALRYNASYYVAGWSEKIYRFRNWSRRPIEGFVGAVGAPQRSTNSALCVALDGLVVAAVSEYSTSSILTSVDAGDTWTTRTTPDTVSPQSIIEVPVSGSVGYRLVCVGLGGIMTSEDRGNTWTVRSSAANFKCVCRDASDSALYACGYTGAESYTADSVIYKSTDNGVTWSSNFLSTAGGMISGIAYNTSTGALVAVTTYGNNRVYVSSNHGTSWSANTTVQKQYWCGVLFDTYRNVMLAWTAALGDGSAYIMRSSDSGSTWTYDSTDVGFNDVILEPGGRLLGCRVDSVQASDNGKDFFPLPDIAAGTWSKLAYSAYHDVVVACAGDGTTRFMTSASSRKTPRRIWWSYDTVPARNFKHGMLSTPSGRILVTATEYSTTSILYSDNVGLTWVAATTPDTLAPTSLVLVPHSNTLGYRLVAVAETTSGTAPALYSDDNGSTWTLASLAGVRGMRGVCRHGATGYLYATGYSGTDTTDTATTEVLKSTDNGATWTSVYTNVGGGVGSCIAYDPIRNSLCVITENGSAHSIVSSDDGTTWTAYTGSARRPWRDMIWDRARGCLVKVCHEGIRTATILGDTYSTVIMPDGKEWLAENLRWTGAGQWWGDAASDDGDGRYYTSSEAWGVLAAALSELGWHVPSLVELTSFGDALGGLSVAAGKLKTSGTSYWAAPNTDASDIYGFSLHGSGRYWGAWNNKNTIVKLWLSASFGGTAYYGADVNVSTLWTGADPAYVSGRLPVRLLRDYTPTSEHMYRSFDGGLTWSPTTNVLPAYSIASDLSGRLFTAGADVGQRTEDGTMYRSLALDQAAQWRKLCFSAHHDKIVGIACAGLSRFLLTGNT